MLKQYSGQNANTADTEAHFDQVTNAVPSSVLGAALADMFRSSDTPPFPQQAAQMFGNADGSQKASVLNELLSSVGPALPSLLGGAGLGTIAANMAAGRIITPEAAEQVPPEVVQEIAEHVDQHDPSIVERLGSFYSQHPALIKTLGSAALAVTLATFWRRSDDVKRFV